MASRFIISVEADAIEGYCLESSFKYLRFSFLVSIEPPVLVKNIIIRNI